MVAKLQSCLTVKVYKAFINLKLAHHLSILSFRNKQVFDIHKSVYHLIWRNNKTN